MIRSQKILVFSTFSIFLFISIGFVVLRYSDSGSSTDEKEGDLINKEPEDDSEPDSESPSLIDMSDWKTYQNNEYGITFKYPNKYIVDVTKQGLFRPGEETYGETLLSFLIFDPKIEPSFGRGVKPEGMATNLFDGFDFSIYTKDKEIYIQRDITSEREVWLQKEEIYREYNVMNTGSDIKIFIFSSLLGPYYITSFSGENKVVVTTSSTHYPIEIFQNILSTFKFIY